jgi:hypothetical protein
MTNGQNQIYILGKFSFPVFFLQPTVLDPTLKPFLIIIINKIILSDATDPSCHI